MKILTVPRRHGLNAGHYVIVQAPDKRLLRHFWYFITFRSPPMKQRRMEVMRVSPTQLWLR